MPKKGFVKAIDLRVGDVLWTVNGKYVIIEKIQHEILEKPIKVYNFRVADNHTYFVGNNSVGVHNKEYVEPGDPKAPENVIRDLRSNLPESKNKINPKTGYPEGNGGKVRGELKINGETTEFNENAYSKYGSVKHTPDDELVVDANGNAKVNNTPDPEKWIQYPEKPKFKDFVSEVDKIWRYNDSECKLIEYVTERIGSDSNPSGEIEIITERPPCDSCQNVIKAFSEEYPNIKITVGDGKGGSYAIQGGLEINE